DLVPAERAASGRRLRGVAGRGARRGLAHGPRGSPAPLSAARGAGQSRARDPHGRRGRDAGRGARAACVDRAAGAYRQPGSRHPAADPARQRRGARRGRAFGEAMSDTPTRPGAPPEAAPLDLAEKGRRNGQEISLDRRLFMKFTAFGRCLDPHAAATALAEDGVTGALYVDANDPQGIGVMVAAEDPGYFVTKLRTLFGHRPFA